MEKITGKKAIECAKMLVKFCEQQGGCQNCIFRSFGPDHWNCNIDAFYLRDVIWNMGAKKKNCGYIQ